MSKAPVVRLEDIRLSRAPENLLNLFGLLGYHTEKQAIPLNKHEIGFNPADLAAIHNLYLLAEQSTPAGDDFLQIILFELDQIALTRLRSLAKNFLDRGGNYLLVATADYRRITFVNPRREEGQIKIRKLVVDTVHPTRHDVDILSGLVVNKQTPTALYLNHCQAFDVERVTNRFHQEYAKLFKRTTQTIQESNKALAFVHDPAELNAFTQRFLGRLMFLYFIQKKGWLAGDNHFLSRQYDLAMRLENNYYAHLLEPLFFETLNQKRPGDNSPWGVIPYLNGGLFERDTDLKNRPITGLYLPNELFDPHDIHAILGFFNTYNFTVAEDTPAEQEVAVDPEMLGKVFENLMEEDERGKSGTFYTPRPIVHYMCREALLGYLQESTHILREQLLPQFDLADNEDLSTPRLSMSQIRQIEKALENITICDPAVGTGAFLVGMLHEMVNLRRACALAKGSTIPRSGADTADWKRQIINHSLYGVDIKRRAIEIAKLRLWLSLVVDLELAYVEPLPNLDYKLRVGNSLLETFEGESLLPSQKLQLWMSETDKAKTDLASLKEEFFDTQDHQKRQKLRGEIETQERMVVRQAIQEKLQLVQEKMTYLVNKGSLANWKGLKKEEKEVEQLVNRQAQLQKLAEQVQNNEPLPFFVYRLHFFEVFQKKGGFDVVIANPPYVRQELIKEQKTDLKVMYPEIFNGVADLYVYFYARGLDILRPSGFLAFIAPNKFMRANYGESLRRLLGEKTTLLNVLDFGDLPVFEATAYPCIVITRKANPQPTSQPTVLNVQTTEQLNKLGEMVQKEGWHLPQIHFKPEGWQLENPQVIRLLQKLREQGEPLEKVVQGQIYYGIKTGFNEAFVINEAQRQELIEQDPRSAELIKPWLRGRDIKRWQINPANLFVIFTRRGVNIEEYPAILNHLLPFKERLTPGHSNGRKSGSYKWYEIQDNIAYYPEFSKPKIVWRAVAESALDFSYDTSDFYVADTTYFWPTSKLEMLGFLNSYAIGFVLDQICDRVQAGYLRIKSSYMEQLPIPLNSPFNLKISQLTQQLLEMRGEGENTAALEAELNDRVYHLFGLTPAEIKLIEEKVTPRP